MDNKKAVINQVFVYIMSTIAILFVGFLVVKFIVAFSSDSKSVIEEKFFVTLENDITQVESRYGSEEVLEYKISGEINQLCFISELSCISELIQYNLPIEQTELDILAENSNLLFFDKDTIITERKISSFKSDNDCFCVEPNNNRFSLLLENRKNELFISEYK